MTQSPGQGNALDNLLTESRTFPPSDDDQGDTIRILTEAVELGEPEQAAPGSEKEPERPAASSSRPRRAADHPKDQTGDAP